MDRGSEPEPQQRAAYAELLRSLLPDTRGPGQLEVRQATRVSGVGIELCMAAKLTGLLYEITGNGVPKPEPALPNKGQER